MTGQGRKLAAASDLINRARQTGEPAKVSFRMSPDNRRLLNPVLDRAAALYARHELPFDRLMVSMDISAADANGCPLDLQRLLDFPDPDFAHDVGGITRYIDRSTGQLTSFFVPRCARPRP